MVERRIEIEAPISYVYRTIRDFASYPEFLSTTESVKERQTKSGLQVDFKVRVIKEISYTLEFELSEPNEVKWHLVRGELMKKNDGFWKLESVSSSLTKAHYGIDVEFGWFVPKAVIEKVTETQLPETLNAFKKRSEHFYRKESA